MIKTTNTYNGSRLRTNSTDNSTQQSGNLAATPLIEPIYPDQEQEDQQQEQDLEQNEDDEFSFFNSYADAQSSVNDSGPNFTHMGYHVGDVSVSLLQVLLLFAVLPLRFLFVSFSVLLSILATFSLKWTKRCCFTLSWLCSSLAWLLLSVYFRCTVQRCAVAQEADATKATMPIILDSGATIAMSGDLSLFVRSSMVPITSSINLAAKGASTQGTHMGKISIHGRLIDCLYVPSFKQTLLSLGWFLNLGMTQSSSSDGNLTILSPNNTTYLKFRLDSNNLFYLDQNSTSQSA